MLRLFPFSSIARTLAVLLTVAAALKLYGLGVEPVAGIGVFSAPELQVAAVEFEVLLAVWLWSGARQILAWAVALTVFTVFAAASLYLAWVGESSCGCFGRASVKPVFALALDVLVLAALLLGRPDFKALRERGPRLLLEGFRSALAVLAGVLVVSAVVFVVLRSQFTSVAQALAYFRGDRLAVEPRLVEMGRDHTGELREVPLQITNWGPDPVRLVGATQDCSRTVKGLPVTIPVGETRQVLLGFRFSGAPGIFTRTAAMLVDHKGLHAVGFRLTGTVVLSDTEETR